MKQKKDKKYFNQKLKSISTIISTSLMNLIIGNSLIWLYLPEKINLSLDNKININKSKKIIFALIITFSNLIKLNFAIFTKYNNIRIYIFFSLLVIIIAHSFLYMFQIKLTTILAFIIYGVGIGTAFHPLRVNSCLHYINHKFNILLINKIFYSISPLIYILFFDKFGNYISPIGSEIIIFYIILLFILPLISYDYIRECRNEEFENKEQNLLIKNELEYSITDMTGSTERGSSQSENSVNLDKKNKSIFGQNEHISRIFISKRQSIISVFSDKNIYLIILFFFSGNFLNCEKIYSIKNDDFFFFLLIVFISNIINYIILLKTQLHSLLLKLIPLFIHILIIIYHTFNSRREGFSIKIELFLVSLSYSIQYNIIFPLLNRIYGERNAGFISSLVINISTSSRWIFVFIDNVRNSLRILIIVFMILLLLVIKTEAFNFNEDQRRKKFGIELENKDNDNDEDKNEENEIEAEDVCDIIDVKSDVES